MPGAGGQLRGALGVAGLSGRHVSTAIAECPLPIPNDIAGVQKIPMCLLIGTKLPTGIVLKDLDGLDYFTMNDVGQGSSSN